MKKTLLTLILASLSCIALARQRIVIPLWPEGKAPGESGLKEEMPNEGYYKNTTTAELWVYLPDKAKANGKAVVICPGGGYHALVIGREGVAPSEWFNEMGIAGIVLKYRMPNGNPDIPKSDVLKAIETVRERAAEWGIDPAKIGVMGYSAGGHLASMASTHFTSPKNRPDFAVLIYPVVTLKEGLGHMGSRYNLIGREYKPALVAEYSNELKVTEATPPTFIGFSSDDKTVDPRNGTLYYDALKGAGVKECELHIYPSGGHGWPAPFRYEDEYRAALSRWLSER